MRKSDLLTEARTLIGDTVEPYAWSDARLLYWMSEGQDKFCEQTGFWVDSTTYTITTVAGQQVYPIPARIITVRSIWDDRRQLEDLSNAGMSTEDFADYDPQYPMHYELNSETGSITILEPCVDGVVLTIKAHRRSKVALNTTAGTVEIPEQFQLALPEYAAAKAFSDHDRELQDPVKATDHKKNFKDYVKDGKTAYRRISGEYADVVPNPLYAV